MEAANVESESAGGSTLKNQVEVGVGTLVWTYREAVKLSSLGLRRKPLP